MNGVPTVEAVDFHPTQVSLPKLSFIVDIGRYGLLLLSRLGQVMVFLKKR